MRNLVKIPESAVQVLKAEYDADPGGRASGFSVHPLIDELREEGES
ncbi:hypothetical protein [Streptomyces sp. YPW6]